MELSRKLRILADAAKYDASCAAGSAARGGERWMRTADGEEAVGIIRSLARDGRVVPLLKILLTNDCVLDCGFCVHRRSNDVPRARFTPAEVAGLVLDFHRRNLVEGLFLSSGVLRDADHTMELMVEAARILREEHAFGGYIHLKAIPAASPELVDRAGRYADRLSVNVELPTEQGLARLAPEKTLVQIRGAMGRIRDGIETAAAARIDSPRAPRFAPAGQTTQLIVGATPATDRTILASAASLYRVERLRRVYYGGYAPVPGADAELPERAPPPERELRLYQADWLIRGYGFDPAELTTPERPDLDPALDPKLAWALRNRDRFLVDLNAASRRELLRIPGLGVTGTERILLMRRHRRVALADLARLHVPLARMLPFIVAADHRPALLEPDSRVLRERFTPPMPRQLELFGGAAVAAGAAR